ncbi:MAG: hypothetical protein U0401_03935 [Anaerolineae bacterium]
MRQNTPSSLPPPDKKIPTSVMLIGTFELAIALWGLIIVALVGHLDSATAVAVILWGIYGTMGAGLLAIQEWARVSNVILHIIAVPYALYAVAFLQMPVGWPVAFQIAISVAIVYALTRPTIRHKFQTVVPKKKLH